MNSTLHNTIEYRGYTIEIHRDSDAESPRTHFDNMGTLYTMHNRYCPEEEFSKYFKYEDVFCQESREFQPKFENEYIAVPVYLYDHSGQSVSTTPFSCRWDSGLFGILAVTHQKALAQMNWKRLSAKRKEQIKTHLQEEIKIYNDYLHGDVYGYIVNDSEGQQIDACWGFYGDKELPYIESECKSIIDFELKNTFLTHLKKFGTQYKLPFPEFPEFGLYPQII